MTSVIYIRVAKHLKYKIKGCESVVVLPLGELLFLERTQVFSVLFSVSRPQQSWGLAKACCSQFMVRRCMTGDAWLK